MTLGLVDHGLLAAQFRQRHAMRLARILDATGDGKVCLAIALAFDARGFDGGALDVDALPLGLLGGKDGARQRAQDHHQDQAVQIHVSAVSTSRRASARKSADCISAKRDTVRGNSCAIGPSV